MDDKYITLYYVQKRLIVMIIMHVIIHCRTSIVSCHSSSTTSSCSDFNSGIKYEHTANLETTLKIYKKFQNVGLGRCQTNCLRHTLCESITYDVTTRVCNLNRGAVEVTLDSTQNFIYTNRSSIEDDTQVYGKSLPIFC